MGAKELLLKLIDIERAIGVADPLKIREMVMQAQESLLAIQKSIADQLQDQRLSPATIEVLDQHDYTHRRYRA